MANASRKTAAYVTIGMAFGQAILALSIVLVSSFRTIKPWAERESLPVWLAIMPLAVGVGLILHMRLCRHVDQGCPWIGLGWLFLTLNLAAIVTFTLAQSS